MRRIAWLTVILGCFAWGLVFSYVGRPSPCGWVEPELRCLIIER